MASVLKSQIEAMKKLGMTDKEIEELVEYDTKVDKNQPTEFDISEEQQKNVQKVSRTTSGERKKPVVVRNKERKTDEVKKPIIDGIVTFLTENTEISAENVKIVKPEREISFDLGGFNYSITLTRHNKPKEK
jgi:hypothetical protein